MSSAIAPNAQIWLVELLCKNFGCVYKLLKKY